MEIIYQQRMSEKSIHSLVDEFEVSLLEHHPWDETPYLHPNEHEVVLNDAEVETQTDLLLDLLAFKEEEEEDSIDNFMLVCKTKDTDLGSLDTVSAQIEEHKCIETPLFVPTSLHTIEEGFSGKSNSLNRSIRHVRFQNTNALRSPEGDQLKNKVLRTNPDRKRKKRPSILKKSRWILCRRKNTKRSGSDTLSSSKENDVPIYSAHSILKDLETLSLSSEKLHGNSKVSRPNRKKGLKMEQKKTTLANTIELEASKSNPEPIQLKKNKLYHFPSQRDSSASVKASSSCWNPFYVIRNKRLWKKYTRNDKSFEQRQKHATARNTNEPLKTSTKIIITANKNRKDDEKDNHSPSVRSANIHQRSSTPESKVQSNGSKIKLAKQDFEQCALGMDVITLLMDTLIHLTSVLGGKLDSTCCTMEETDKEDGGLSLILVGSNGSVRGWTESSHEILMNRLETNKEEFKQNDR